MATVRLISAPHSKLSNIEPIKSKIKLHTLDATHIIKKEDILYLKSNSNYCEVYFTNGLKMCCSQTLKSLENKLKDPIFYRVHNSYVVNMSYLNKVNSSFTSLYLSDSIVIPISRSNKTRFKEKLDILFD